MDFLTASDFTHKNGQTTHYYEGGNKDGIPLIFIHGWPDIAESWKHQLKYFAATSKYRVIAPDMRGYGDSSAPSDKRQYSLQVLTDELVEFAAHLNVQKAVWIGHDWGCGVVNALAAHHPNIFLGLVVMAVPYRTIELGLDYLVSKVNREIYPKDEYEYGQWSYMKYYELHSEKSIKDFTDYTEKITKAKYVPVDPATWGKPSAATATTLKDNGWFKGHPELLPDVPLEYTCLDESLFKNLLKSHQKHGWFPPTAYYLNHDVNAEFSKSSVNNGTLEFPVLYVDAKYDSVCSPSTSPLLGESQAGACKDLECVTIEAGHWAHLEKPDEANEKLGSWFAKKF